MSDYKVGINYFSGWWRTAPNKYVLHGIDWRTIPEYGGRCALLGSYNDAATVDAEIIAASDYGVDFFQFLWYGEYADCPEHGLGLNNGLIHFASSPESYRMKFTVEYCNHPPFGIIDDSLWDDSCDEWISYMLHPSYLRIDGKAVFKIHGYDLFVEQCAHDESLFASRIETLREKARDAGVGELYIGAGICSPEPVSKEAEKFYSKLDYFNTYMMLPDLPQSDIIQPYEQLLDYAMSYWHGQGEGSPLPYMPFMPAGWDPRPWSDSRRSYRFPDRAQWREALEKMKAALDSEKMLSCEGEKLFTIYAWNEFGEGGIVAPTAGDGYMKLEEIKHVFG